MRGEYKPPASPVASSAELPPRARRIRTTTCTRAPHGGTTSACAENTRKSKFRLRAKWNYLRVRGEYFPALIHNCHLRELPPRARRIRPRLSPRFIAHGTTSACAENTKRYQFAPPAKWNYLRVRGEYLKAALEPVVEAELPPRARRIRMIGYMPCCSRGTTSACAENTRGTCSRRRLGRNYLRVRGEYPTARRH